MFLNSDLACAFTIHALPLGDLGVFIIPPSYKWADIKIGLSTINNHFH